MEKKKLKLSISGSSKKTINNIEKAKFKSKNSVIIEKSSGRTQQKNFSRNFNSKVSTKPNFTSKKPSFLKSNLSNQSDFEKRKQAEQRATKRLKGESVAKETKGKLSPRRRELKLTISRALSDDDSFSKFLASENLKYVHKLLRFCVCG